MKIPAEILEALSHRCTVGGALPENDSDNWGSSWFYTRTEHDDVVKAFVAMYAATVEGQAFIQGDVDAPEFQGSQDDDPAYSQINIGIFSERIQRGEVKY